MCIFFNPYISSHTFKVGICWHFSNDLYIQKKNCIYGMGWYTKWHGVNYILPNKAQKGVHKLERKHYGNNHCIIDGANFYQFHHFKYFLGNSS